MQIESDEQNLNQKLKCKRNNAQYLSHQGFVPRCWHDVRYETSRCFKIQFHHLEHISGIKLTLASVSAASKDGKKN